MFSIAATRASALGAVTGALYVAAAPPYGVAALGWLVLAPLWVAIAAAPRGRVALAAGGAAGMVAAFGAYFWIADTAHRFWQVPWSFALLLLGIFATFAELHFAVFALVAWRFRRRFERWPAAVGAALFTACEIVVPRIFPDKLGHNQVDAGPLPFAAALVGTHGLSFLLAWAALALARALPARFRGTAATPGRARVVTELVACAVAVVGLAAWGQVRRAEVARTPPERVIDVAIVQSNIGDPEEIAARLGSVTAAIDSTVNAYAHATLAMAGEAPPDLVVWPETAVPAVPRPRIIERLQQIVTATRTTLVFGGYDSERRADNRFRLYNSAFHMDATGTLRGRYAKHRLLLFGEYVPLSDRFPQLLEILPSPGEFTPGPGPRVFEVAGVAFTPLICYELLFPDVVRSALRAGGTTILNLTNDYWFGQHLEPHQHLALTRMCALEVGRPIVRATNTGISAFIGADGVVRARTGVWESAVLRDALPVPPMRWTPYARWGDLMVAALAGAACALVLLGWGIRRDRARVPPAAAVAPARDAQRSAAAGAATGRDRT